MKHKLATAGVVAAALVLSTASVAGIGRQPAGAAEVTRTTWPIDSFGTPREGDNVVLKWNEQLLATIRDNPADTGPTVTARALGVVHTSMYDAWAAYDAVAKGTQLGSSLRRPLEERTLANKEKAISFAAYTTLIDLFPYREPVYAAQMTSLTYTNFATDDSTAASVGIRAAQANIAYRHGDGTNPTLDTGKLENDPSDDRVRYPCSITSTPCFYSPVNAWNKVNDPWRWQPLCVPLPQPTATSCSTEQKPLTPHWGKAKAFAAMQPYQYAVPGPPRSSSGTYSTLDIETAISDTSNLDDTKKALAEYWADGPKSEFPPGHTALFAQALSRKRGHSLDTDVKMFFAMGNTMMDASFVSWYQKYKYDFARPITAIRAQKQGKLINTWLGPNNGYGLRPGEQWMPYQALGVVTPAFPEYVSGHSAFTAGGATILSLFTGGDTFGASVTIPAKTSKFETDTPATDVTLSWATFSDASNQAGMSRRYGGIHFKSGDDHGRGIGRQVAQYVWAKARTYINGTSAG